MGMFGSLFGSSAPAQALPLSQDVAAYQPSKVDVFLQTLFGEGSPADAADHLRQLHYQQAMRPYTATEAQDWFGGPGGPGGPGSPIVPQQGAQAPQAPPPSAPPATMNDAMGAGLGSAVGGTVVSPLVPQIGAAPQAPAPAAPARPNLTNLQDPRVQQWLARGMKTGMPGAKELLELGQAVQPHMVQAADNSFVNDKDGSIGNRQFIKLGEGQIARHDGAGNDIGLDNAPGYGSALAEQEAIKAVAKAKADADYAQQAAQGKAQGEATVANANTLETRQIGDQTVTKTRGEWLADAGGGSADQAPRGIRNNNPLNVTSLPHGAWDGQTGSDGKYAQFSTPEAGWAAADKNLQSYAQHHGVDTLAGVIKRWAPSSENDTQSYIATVANDLGVDPNAKLNLTDPGVRQRVLQSMAKVETGRQVAAPAQGQQQPTQRGIVSYSKEDQKKVADAEATAKLAEDLAESGHRFLATNKTTFTDPSLKAFDVPIPFTHTKVDINPAGIYTQRSANIPSMEREAITQATGLRSLGQRLTQMEFQKNLGASMTHENTLDQNQKIGSGFDATAGYQRSYANFVRDYLNQHGTLNGADTAWAAQRNGGGKQQSQQSQTQAAPSRPVQRGTPIKLPDGQVAVVRPRG